MDIPALLAKSKTSLAVSIVRKESKEHKQPKEQNKLTPYILMTEKQKDKLHGTYNDRD